jgi:hypothetical protein
MADDCAKPDVAATPDEPRWRSTKFWYSVVLQVLATGLLVTKFIDAGTWAMVSLTIYGTYVVGNVGAMAFGNGSISRR